MKIEEVRGLSEGLMKEVPKVAKYGGTRYAYGLAPKVPCWTYDHQLGEFVLIGPNEEYPDGWQFSFFLHDEDGTAKWSEYRTFDETGAEEDDMVGAAEDIALALSQRKTLQELEAYFQKEGFEAI